MNKKEIQEAIQQAKEKSPKRNFKQSIEVILNLRGMDLKKQDDRVDIFTQLPHSTGKDKKIGCFAGPELKEQAKSNCHAVVMHDEFGKYSEKKDIKKLARDIDWFIAQATIMPDVAKTFGRVLGPLGKMPNPKAGGVVPPNANLKPLIERLKNTIRLQTRDQYAVKARVGTEEMEEDKIAENIEAIHKSMTNALPQGEANIKEVLVKTTMGPPVEVGGKK